MLASRLPANTLQGMMDLCCQALCDDGDTFYSQRVFDLFPQMATTNSGWSTHQANASSVFGSHVNTDASNDSDYIEWIVYVPGGNYKLTNFRPTTSASGKADLAVDGGSVLDTDNQYSGATVNNARWTSAQFVLSEGSHTVRLTKNGKDGSSAGYSLTCIHAQLIKQDATSAIASVANVPHVIDIPVVFADSHTNWNTLVVATSYPFGTVLMSSAAQNATVTLSFWAPKGNATLAIGHRSGTGNGIYAVSVDGSSWGTFDGYDAAIPDKLDTSLSGTIATTGIHTITFLMSTKNASSTNYQGKIHGIQIRMTSITEPLSSDLAPSSALFWPVFNEAATGLSAVTASVNSAYFYWVGNAGTQNDEITLSTNSVLRPGTYRLDVVTHTWTNRAKMHVLVDSVDLGNYDAYSAGAVYNVVGTVSGLVLTGFSPHTIKLKLSSKNASSSSYFGYATLARLIRTGS